MGGVVPIGSQPLNDSLGDPHVREKTHSDSSARHYSFLRQPRDIFKRLLNVVALKIGIIAQYLVHRRAVRDLPYYD